MWRSPVGVAMMPDFVVVEELGVGVDGMVVEMMEGVGWL